MTTKEKFKEILTYGYCSGYHCEKNTPAIKKHTCPYAAEIFGDHDSLCDCCEECANECAMDI